MTPEIRAELFRAARRKRVWVILALVGVVVPAITLAVAKFTDTRAGGTFVDSDGTVTRIVDAFTGPYGLASNNLMGVWAMVYLVLPLVAANLLIGEERGLKTWKVILPAQPNRARVLAGKFVAGLALVGLWLVGGGALAALIGLLGGPLLGLPGSGGDWLDLLARYGAQLLLLTGPLALGFLASWFIASPGLALATALVGPSILEGAALLIAPTFLRPLNILNAAVQALELQRRIQAMQEWFFTVNASLGAGRAGRAIMAGTSDVTWEGIGHSLMVMAVYSAVFAILLVVSFLRRDVHE